MCIRLRNKAEWRGEVDINRIKGRKRETDHKGELYMNKVNRVKRMDLNGKENTNEKS